MKEEPPADRGRFLVDYDMGPGPGWTAYAEIVRDGSGHLMGIRVTPVEDFEEAVCPK